MANAFKGLLQSRILQTHLQSVRYKAKVNVTRPRPPHFRKAIVEHICKPYFGLEKKLKHVPPFETCTGFEGKLPEPIHPLESILAKEALNWFKHSNLIAFFHQNALDKHEKFQAQLLLKRSKIRYLHYTKRVINLALTGTVYEPVLILFQNHTSIGVSSEQGLQELLKVSKKLPKLVLMAAIFDNKLLSYSELEYYGKIENLDAARMSLLGTLNSVSNNLVQKINHHPNNIVQLLQQHQEQNKTKS